MARGEATLGAAALAVLILVAIFAPALSEADPTVQYDSVHGANLAPGARRIEIVKTDGSRLLALRAETTTEGVVVTLGSPTNTTELVRATNLVAGPDSKLVRERRFPLGTDRVGRDIWSRLLHGTRVSLIVASLAACLASLFGVLVGSLAALGGRATDLTVMRITDGFLAFPRLFLLLALAAFLNAGMITIVLVLGATSWMSVSRLVRAELLRLKNTEMAVAAEASGSGRLRTLARHLLPNALAPVMVATSLRVGDVLLLEAALSFLGLGIQPPKPSWGRMVADGLPDLSTAWWTSTLPGVAIVVTVIAFNLLGDGLQGLYRRRSDTASRVGGTTTPGVAPKRIGAIG